MVFNLIPVGNALYDLKIVAACRAHHLDVMPKLIN
jgi:hypothetical protein